MPLVLLAPLALTLSWIDLRQHRLPNRLVAAAFALGVLLSPPHHISSSVLSAATLVALYLFLHVVSRRGIGMGDVKLSAVIGLFGGQISWSTPWIATWIAFVLGGIWALVLIARGKRKTHIAFGPFMLAGLYLSVLI